MPRVACLVLVALALCCARTRPALLRPPAADEIGTFDLTGEFSIPPLGRFPPITGLPFGGISGLAPDASGSELLGISDADGTRVYRFRLSGAGTSFQVATIDYIPLERPFHAPADLDAEAIALTRRGTLIIASEGMGDREPRVGPALVEFGPQGQFLRHFQVRDRYAPNPSGALTHGVRDNLGLESLTIAPTGKRLFTAIETALVQDGEPATFDHGALARILEYSGGGESWRPAREFAYPVEPVPDLGIQAVLAENGLVELLALDETTLLSLERSYVEDGGGSGRSRIRVFRVTIDGASDVSEIESLQNARGIVPVRKTPLLDLSNVAGLSPQLAEALDNFEGMAFGPRLDGGPSLILVSDDNFSATQRTTFLLFSIAARAATAVSAVQ